MKTGTIARPGATVRTGAKGRTANQYVAVARWWFAVLLLCLVPVAGSAAGLPDIVRKVKGGIVGIGTYAELRRPPAKLMGTGFAVADGSYIVTNNHVVDRALKDKAGEALVVFIGAGKRAKLVKASVMATDAAHDVAILKVAGHRLRPLKIGDTRKVEDGQSIAFTGYPIGAVLGLYPVTHRGIIAARTPIAIPQTSPRRLDAAMIKRLRERFEVFQLDATAYPGNSGSPLYDRASGAVLGIISSVFVKTTKEKVLSDPSGITYAVPITHAVDLLRKLGVEP